jgi:ribosomal protein L37AE/L43A
MGQKIRSTVGGQMKRSTMTSRPGSLVCPFCEAGELERTGSYSARCISCGRVTGRLVLETLHQIITLPESLGAHACECGHPEMRRLSDGMFHCPACGSEIPGETRQTITKAMRCHNENDGSAERNREAVE